MAEIVWMRLRGVIRSIRTTAIADVITTRKTTAGLIGPPPPLRTAIRAARPATTRIKSARIADKSMENDLDEAPPPKVAGTPPEGESVGEGRGPKGRGLFLASQ